MALPKPNASWPPEHPLREQQKHMMAWYSGQNPLNPVKIENRLLPDPAGSRPSANRETKNVHSNMAADLAGVAAELLLGETPALSVNEGSYINQIITAEQADRSQTTLTAMMESTGAWSVIRTSAELASVTGESYIRVIADPTSLELPIIQAIPSTDVDPTWRYGQLVSARIWTTVAIDGASILRWVEERDNAARVIRNGLYLGSETSIGERLPLASHPATSGLPEEQEYPEGIDKMVWHLVNARPSRLAPDMPHGRSDLEGSDSLLATLDLIYTSMARDFRLGQARLIVPTASLSRGLNGGALWDNSREIMTDLDLDPANPASKPDLMQPSLRVTEHVEAATAVITRIIESAGYSPQSFGIGEYGSASSGTALRVRQSKTIATIAARRSLWGPQIGSIIETLSLLARYVYGYDVVPARPVVVWPDLVTPDPEVTARQIQLLVVAGAVSTETAVKMAQPTLSAAEVDAEVERIRSEKAAGVDSQTTNNEPSVDPMSDMVTISPEQPE